MATNQVDNKRGKKFSPLEPKLVFASKLKSRVVMAKATITHDACNIVGELDNGSYSAQYHGDPSFILRYVAILDQLEALGRDMHASEGKVWPVVRRVLGRRD